MLCLLATTKVTLQSRFSKNDNGGLIYNLLYNSIVFFAVALSFTPFLIIKGIDTPTVISGIIMGVLSTVFQIFYVCAFSTGKMALTVIICDFSMIVPMAFSYFTYHEDFSIINLCGTALALLAFVLCAVNGKKETQKEKNYVRWLAFISVVFLSNSFISINQKVYSMENEVTNPFGFVAVAYITAFILSALLMAFLKGKEKNVTLTVPKGVIISAVLAGICLGVFQCINTYANGIIDGTLLYSTYNCGCSVLSIIVGRALFKEKLSKRQYMGAAVGVAAILLLCL